MIPLGTLVHVALNARHMPYFGLALVLPLNARLVLADNVPGLGAAPAGAAAVGPRAGAPLEQLLRQDVVVLVVVCGGRDAFAGVVLVAQARPRVIRPQQARALGLVQRLRLHGHGRAAAVRAVAQRSARDAAFLRVDVAGTFAGEPVAGHPMRAVFYLSLARFPHHRNLTGIARFRS